MRWQSSFALPLLLCCWGRGVQARAFLRSAKESRDLVGKAAPGGKELLFLLENETEAVCLDGSPPGYYWRPGSGDGAFKFLIFYEGGGWCFTREQCLQRSTTELGSSNKWPPRIDLGKEVGGYFSTDSAINPAFYNWNLVLLKYCDGGSFAGHVVEPVTVGGVDLFFRGRAINEVLINELIQTRGLDEATDVVIAGCSAGGLAVYLHIDLWSEALTGTDAKIRGLADSGFFLNANLNGCQFGANMRHAAEMHRVDGGVNDRCVRAYARGLSGGGTYHCFLGQYVLPFVQTPTFSTVSRFDSVFMDGIACVEKTESQAINDIGGLFAPVFVDSVRQSNVSHGYLIDTCTRHCNIRAYSYNQSYDYWNGAKGPRGESAQDIFQSWYAGAGSNDLWRQEGIKAYPDASCPLV